MLVFLGEGKTGVTGEKPLRAEKRTNNKLDPHEMPSPGIEPRVTLVGGEFSHHYTIPALAGVLVHLRIIPRSKSQGNHEFYKDWWREVVWS